MTDSIPTPIPKPRLRRLARTLIEWFEANARDLPWRGANDPYAVWISEIMLQQTQVKTAAPYYERWMRRLPNVHALARAGESTVLKLWEGLGYYSRARNLQISARIVVKEHQGRFPLDYDKALALPGIGPYTAGAVLSIAGNLPAPIVDGNVQRVFSRLFKMEVPVEEKRARDFLWSTAAEYARQAARMNAIHPRACGQANQALMELGATICLPASPACHACPVNRRCTGRIAGVAAQLPVKNARPSQTSVQYHALILQHRQQYLIRKRPERQRNGGLWEFPNNADQPGTDWPEYFKREYGCAEDVPLRRLFAEQHSITRYRYTVDVHYGRVDAPSIPAGERSRWAAAGELERLAFAGAHRRIWNRFRKIRI